MISAYRELSEVATVRGMDHSFAPPSVSPMPKTKRAIPEIAALIAVLTWASAFIGISFALHTLPPSLLVLMRFIVASLCFIAFAAFGRVRLPAWRDAPILLLLGVVGQVIYQLALSTAQT